MRALRALLTTKMAEGDGIVFLEGTCQVIEQLIG